MGQGPVFGITSSPVIQKDLMAILSGMADRLSANRRANQRLQFDREKFEQQKQDNVAAEKTREEVNSLKEEKFELEKERETRLKKESESRITSRTARTARGGKDTETRRINSQISFFRQLSKEQQSIATNINRNIADGVRQQPLESEEFDLTEFAGKPSQEIATIFSRRERAFGNIDEFDRADHEQRIAGGQPGLPRVTIAEQQLNAAGAALDIRKQQELDGIEARGPAHTNDQLILSNLRNGLQTSLASVLGLIPPGGEEQAPKDRTGPASQDIKQATQQKPADRTPTIGPLKGVKGVETLEQRPGDINLGPAFGVTGTDFDVDGPPSIGQNAEMDSIIKQFQSGDETQIGQARNSITGKGDQEVAGVANQLEAGGMAKDIIIKLLGL